MRHALAPERMASARKFPFSSSGAFSGASRILVDCSWPGEWLEFMLRWQMFTGAVMAKGFEDTAFYTHYCSPLPERGRRRSLPQRGHLRYRAFSSF